MLRKVIRERNWQKLVPFSIAIFNLLMDQEYVEFAYMTGVLPIEKYHSDTLCSSGSELNIFLEYDMVIKKRFSFYFGFLDSEVDMLFSEYRERVLAPEPEITREDLRV